MFHHSYTHLFPHSHTCVHLHINSYWDTHASTTVGAVWGDVCVGATDDGFTDLIDGDIEDSRAFLKLVDDMKALFTDTLLPAAEYVSPSLCLHSLCARLC